MVQWLVSKHYYAGKIRIRTFSYLPKFLLPFRTMSWPHASVRPCNWKSLQIWVAGRHKVWICYRFPSMLHRSNSCAMTMPKNCWHACPISIFRPTKLNWKLPNRACPSMVPIMWFAPSTCWNRLESRFRWMISALDILRWLACRTIRSIASRLTATL